MSVRSRPLLLRVYDLTTHGSGLASPQMRKFAAALADVEGPVLGLDVGVKNIGVAMSDAERQVAFSHTGFRRKAVIGDISTIRAIAHDASVRAAVVGMPVPRFQQDWGKLQQFVRGYSTHVLAECGIEVIGFWDESYTTMMAKDAFMKRSKKRLRNRLSLRKRTVDADAAGLILQDALDAVKQLE